MLSRLTAPSPRSAWILLVASVAFVMAFVCVPVLLLHPFRAQSPLEVNLAYSMRRAAPLVSALALLAILGLCAVLVRGRKVRWSWIPLTVLLVVAFGCAWFAWQNHFEWMFNPNPNPAYARAGKVAFVRDEDMVIAVEVNGDAVAYPVRQMAYHHLVMDSVGGVPVVSTYCTLCHTGLVWKRTLDGRILTFHLYGINNQNMLMRDRETGSWWQQATGESIAGPLHGRRLEGLVHDEISFAVFRRERPRGRVLQPAAGFADDYAPGNWEHRMKKVRTVTARTPDDLLGARTHVVGVALGGRAKAYPFPVIRTGGPVNDLVGGVAIAVVVGEDRKSVRVFDRTVGDRRLELFAKQGASPIVLLDAQTGSEWDFSGRATSGPLAGATLPKVKAVKEYWFDWKLHQPATALYLPPPSR